MSIQFNDVAAWVKSNELILGLLASAIVGTMPETLPGFREFPQWAWTWFRDASKTFLNFRKGAVVEPPPTVPPVKPKLPEGPQQLNG